MNAESNASKRLPDCVVIDTNIWRSSLLLKTSIGASLVYTLGRQGGMLGLPEVVERELVNQTAEIALEAQAGLEQSARILSALNGSIFHSPLVQLAEIEQLVSARLLELAPILFRLEFTPEHAKAALDMVNAKLPPNGEKNQQFKDSAIWQAILGLLKKNAVYFVTADTGFFLDRNTSKGLAKNLAEDCAAAGGSLEIFGDLGGCLEAITRDTPSIDRQRLLTQIEAVLRPQILTEATRHGYQLQGVLEDKITAFLTPDVDRLALDYTIVMRFDPNNSAINYRDADCRVIAYGSCYYNRSSDSIQDAFVEEVRFIAKSATGRSVSARSFTYEDPAIPFRRALPWD